MIIRRICTDHDGAEIPGVAVVRHDDVDVMSTENGLLLVARQGTGQSVAIARPISSEIPEPGLAFLDVLVEIDKQPGFYRREAWRVTE